MSGTQIFWSCAAVGYVIFLFAMINSGDGFGGICLALISGVVAGIAGAIYAISRLVKWFSGRGTAASQDRKTTKHSVQKELRKVKKQADSNMAALLQYIHDAICAGQNNEAIRASLLKKGWEENRVRAAFSAYQDMLGRHPLPKKGLEA